MGYDDTVQISLLDSAISLWARRMAIMFVELLRRVKFMHDISSSTRTGIGTWSSAATTLMASMFSWPAIVDRWLRGLCNEIGRILCFKVT